MSTRRCIPILTLAGLAFASTALAQYTPSPSPNPAGTTSGTTTTRTSTTTGTTYNIQNGEIVSVSGNTFIVKSADGYRQITVAPDYRFMVNGQQMTITQLKPGMALNSTVQMTGPAVTLNPTEMRNSEIVSVSGNTVVIRDASGQQKNLSDDFVLMKDGRIIAATELRPGDRVTAVMLTEGTSTGTTGMTGTTGTTGTVSTSGAASATPGTGTVTPRSPAPSDPSTDVASSSRYDADDDTGSLPKTASRWPMVGLVGLLLLGLGGAVTLARRFYVG